MSNKNVCIEVLVTCMAERLKIVLMISENFSSFNHSSFIYEVYLFKNSNYTRNNLKNEFYTPSLVGLEVLHTQICHFLINRNFQDGRRRHLDLLKTQGGDF